jgi:NAD+ kinase
MKNITITTNFRVAEKAEIARAVASKLLSCGANLILPNFARGIIDEVDSTKFVAPEKVYDNIDLVVVIGGDGTVLEAARRAAVRNIPILGINKGRLGYMTAIEVNELDLLDEVLGGNCYFDDRAMLEVQLIHNGKPLYVSRALNDAVVSNGAMAKIVDMQLYSNGDLVANYRADGLIVTTPSGSTAYSLSAGGPIMAPNVSAFCVTPVCSHSFRDRPIVFSDSSVLEIKNICDREPYLYLSIDGRINIRVMKNQIVRITKSDKIARLVRIKDHNFYADLCNKLASVQ